MKNEVRTETTVPKLKFKNIFGYGCGDAGGVITLTIVGMYMARYLQVHLQINPAVLATMLLVWNIWDAVNDPLMGTIMDVVFSRSKKGRDKFRPWILASIPVIMFGMIAFYAVPPHMGGGMAMMISVFILKIIYEGGYTMMNIGMGSLLGAMATNDNERAKLASARGFGSTIGGLLAGIVVPQILAHFGENTRGFTIAAVVGAILGGFVIFLHYALTIERNKFMEAAAPETAEDKEQQKFKLSDIWQIFTHNRAFMALILHSISICAVQTLGTSAMVYMYTDVLGDIGMQSYATMLGSALMIGILLAAPMLTKKWDLVDVIRSCLVAGFVLYVGLMAYCMMVPNLNAWIFMIWNSVATAMITMSVQMQWGLVAESIDYNEYLTGKRNEGTIYGFFSLSRRVGNTIASSASVLLIAAIGYDPELTLAGLPQAAGTITGIKLFVVGFPMLAAVCSYLCFTYVWNINKDVRAKMAAWKAGKLEG